jgi:hypothetical protein
MRHALLRSLILLSAVSWLLVAGCFRSTPTLLRWKLQPGDTLRYATTQVTTIRTLGDGKRRPTITSIVTTTSDETWKIQSLDKDGIATIDRTVERIRGKSQGSHEIAMEFDSASDKPPTGEAKEIASMLNPMLQRPFAIRMSPRGEVLAAKAPQRFIDGLRKSFRGSSVCDLVGGDMCKTMQTTVFLPEEPVVPGRTWSREDEFPLPMTVGKLAVQYKYEYLGAKHRNGIEVQKIGMTMTAMCEQAQQNNGEKSKTATNLPLLAKPGEVRTDGTIYFDNVRGQIVDCELTTKMTFDKSVAGIQISRQIESFAQMRLLPTDDGKQ